MAKVHAALLAKSLAPLLVIVMSGLILCWRTDWFCRNKTNVLKIKNNLCDRQNISIKYLLFSGNNCRM